MNSVGSIVRGALRDFRRTWPQLVLTDLLCRALAVIVLTPVIGLLLKLFLLTADDGVLTDADIAVFLLHPIGMAALVIVGAVVIAIRFAEQGVLMVIGFGAISDRRVSWLEAVGYVVRHGRGILHLAGRVLLRVLLLVVPFVAAIGGVYLLLLSEYDINFYLAERPAEFRAALALAGVLLAGLAIIALVKFSDWILGLPMVLFGGVAGGRALGKSAERTRDSRWKIVGGVAGWLAFKALLSTTVTYAVGFSGSVLVPDVYGNFVLVMAGLALTLVLAGLANLALSMVATMVFSLLLARVYRALAGPGRLDPSPADSEPLAQRATLQIQGKTIAAGVAAALLAVAIGAYVVADGLDEQDDVEVIAHRGASVAAPENTLAAFERALVDGTDWIELDVQEDADGVVIVAHDSDFMKLSHSRLKVWDATQDDLRDLDIGSWFAPEFADERVPTLAEVLEKARGRAGVVIELKYYGHDEALEARTVEVVETTGMSDDVMIMSLKLAGLRKAAALRPEWPHGLLNTASVGDLTRLDVDFLALNAAAASSSMIKRAHKRGLRVFVWTINDPVQMSVMISRGADGIITDEPALVRKVIELREELSPIGRLVVWIAGEAGLLRGEAVDEASSAEDA